MGKGGYELYGYVNFIAPPFLPTRVTTVYNNLQPLWPFRTVNIKFPPSTNRCILREERKTVCPFGEDRLLPETNSLGAKSPSWRISANNISGRRASQLQVCRLSSPSHLIPATTTRDRVIPSGTQSILIRQFPHLIILKIKTKKRNKMKRIEKNYERDSQKDRTAKRR